MGGAQVDDVRRYEAAEQLRARCERGAQWRAQVPLELRLLAHHAALPVRVVRLHNHHRVLERARLEVAVDEERQRRVAREEEDGQHARGLRATRLREELGLGLGLGLRLN